MNSASRAAFKQIMLEILEESSEYSYLVEDTDSYKTILNYFLEYIYDYDPLMLDYPEDYGFDPEFLEYIKAEYSKYCAVRDPEEDAKWTALQNAEVVLTVQMSDGEVREYNSVNGEETFLNDFCEDIRDIVGDEFSSQEIDDMAKEIYYEGLSQGTISEDEIYELASQYVAG